MTSVAVRGVSRTYAGRPPVPALRRVDLDVPSGSITAVLGPSGCGKTTLLRILAGFDRPDEGTVSFDGEVVSQPGRAMPPERRRVGIVPQEGALFPHLDVAGNVAFGLTGRGLGGWRSRLGRWAGGRLGGGLGPEAGILRGGLLGRDGPGVAAGAGADRAAGAEEMAGVDRLGALNGMGTGEADRAGAFEVVDPAERVAEVLELVELSGFERRRPHELSGGQQQRVALARALAPAPAVVLLDEPFTALDAGLRDALRQQVVRTLRQAGTTAVLVTHDQGEAMSMADHLVVMRAGEVVQSGAPDEVYRRPVDVGVAQFLGEAVLLPGHVKAGTVEFALGSVGANGTADRATVTVCLRPEQVVRDDAGGYRGRVVEVQYRGHDVLVDLVVADGTRIRARWSSVELPRVDDLVGLRVDGPAVVLSPS